MKQTINFEQFCDEWNQFDQRKDSFSYYAKRALFDWLEECSADIGEEEYMLDIVALDCAYTEYASWEEFKDDYPYMMKLEDLQDATTVIDIPETNGFIIEQF